MESDLAIRPIYHHVQPRVEAHIFIAFMGYCLLAALGKHLSSLALGQMPRAVLGATGVDPNAERLPARNRRPLVILPLHTELEPERKTLLEKLKLERIVDSCSGRLFF